MRHYAPGVPIILVGTKLGIMFYLLYARLCISYADNFSISKMHMLLLYVIMSSMKFELIIIPSI